MKPAGFEHASLLAKKRREDLKNSGTIDKIQWIRDNISYNSDWTMNIIKLHKTFCEDVSWIGQTCNWEDAKQLAILKWYTLPTDYNDTDSDEVKQQSDWYTVINVFSNGNGDTTEGRKLFRDMAWCTGRYWTATPYKDEKWEEVKDVACVRIMNRANCARNWLFTDDDTRVCAFKPAS